jgi:hypothetical protein
MSKTEENDGRGALVLSPKMPLRGRFTLLVSDSFCVETTEEGNGVLARLDQDTPRSGRTHRGQGSP